MPRFEVRHAYRSSRDGQQYGPWTAGETVELSDADADWVNRDSPGCLLAAGGIIESPVLTASPDGPERMKPAAADRQHRGGRNRSGS